MKTFRNIVIGICIILGIYMTVDYIRIKKQINEVRTEIREVHDTIVKTRVDSIFYQSPIVYKVKEIRTDTEAVWSPQIHDTVYVELPYIQKEYRDSTYEAYVSGYKDVNLDSIRIFKEKQIIEINNTKYVTKYKNRPFSLGLQVGAQYNFITKRPEPFFGIGVSYNIINFGKR